MLPTPSWNLVLFEGQALSSPVDWSMAWIWISYPLMNEDHMRLMLWDVQLVMFGWIDVSPSSVARWFLLLSEEHLPGMNWTAFQICCVETTGRRSCHFVLKAMNQLFTCSLAVTDVVIAARKSAKHSTDGPVMPSPETALSSSVTRRSRTSLGRCCVLATFVQSQLIF